MRLPASKILWILVAGAVILGGVSLGLFISDQENPVSFYGFIITVILIAIAMSVHISAHSWNTPDISVRMADNAKEIILTNKGNAAALNIHVSLVPMNIEYSPPDIPPDGDHHHPLDSMLEQVKVVVTFENSLGSHYQKTALISSLGPDDDDILKPMFPLFKWKPGP